MQIKKAAATRAVIAAVVTVVEMVVEMANAGANVLVQAKVHNCPIKAKIVRHVVSKAAMQIAKHR